MDTMNPNFHGTRRSRMTRIAPIKFCSARTSTALSKRQHVAGLRTVLCTTPSPIRVHSWLVISFAQNNLIHLNASTLQRFNHGAKPYFLYAGASGNAGGSKPSSSSSSGLNARPDGVTTRAVTKMIKFFLMC
jgi:hypothetical protein